ncbi:MAG: LacI family DNA-binding transcriptional regulator [Verrucomicrobiales bacterium]
MREIGEACGLSQSTVSRALSGNLMIPERTRKKVQAVAVSLGYMPDARMNELMARVRHGRKSGYQGQLAILYLKAGVRNKLSALKQLQQMVLGARERAEELGYGITEFSPEEEQLEGRGLARFLEARGIKGCLFTAPKSPDIDLDFSWERFSCVSMGFLSTNPRLHASIPDWTADARRATSHLLAEGKRRIGFVYETNSDPALGDAWLGGYASILLSRGIRPLVLRGSSIPVARIRKWAKEKRVDSVVSHSDFVGKALQGMEVPPAIVFVNLDQPRPGQRGLITRCRETGRGALSLLVEQIRHGVVGVPECRKKIMVAGTWTEAL